MNIGLVRRGYSATGGAEAYLRRFARALCDAGHRCDLYASDDWPESEWKCGSVHRVAGDSPRKFADALEAMRPACDVLFSLERVWRCDFYRAGDGVHRVWLDRLRHYESAFGTWFREGRSKNRELLTLEARLFTPGATGMVIANSQMVRDEIVRCYGYPAGRIEVVYNGIPMCSPANAAALREQTRQRLGLDDATLAVLFVGSGWRRKGLRYAIAAVGGIKNARLLVAGRPEKTFLRTRGAQFLGPVADPAPFYAAADVFLLPTLYDPFSNACLEACAAGLPVITTNANGFSEIIESGRDGEVLADPADIASLTRAIEAWRDPAKRMEARARLPRLAAQFDIATNVRKTLDVFERARPPA